MTWTRSSRSTPVTATTIPTTSAPDPAAGSDLRSLQGNLAQPLGLPQGSSRPALYLTALLIGAVVGFAVWYLSINLGQAPHRIIKLLLGLLAVTLFFSFPRVTPFVIILAMPFVSWLPQSPIPFVNAVNVIIAFSLINVVRVRAQGSVRARERLPGIWTVYIVFLGALLFSFFRGWLIPPPGLPYAALDRAKNLWTAIAAFLVFLPFYRFLDSPRFVRRALVVFALSLALGAIGCIVQSHGSPEGYRIGGGVGASNNLGAFYAEGLILFLPLLTRRGVFSVRTKLFLIPLLALSFMGLVLPNSRGAFIAFAASGVVYLGAMRPKLLIPYVAALAIGWTLMPTTVKDRMSGTYSEVIDSGGDYATLGESEGRINIWRASLTVARDHPLVGVGFLNLPTMIGEQIDRSRNSHNIYLQMACEGGIIGFATLLAMFIAIFRLTLQLRRHDDEFVRVIGEAAFAMTVCMVITNVFGDRFLHFPLEALLMLVTAICAGLLTRKLPERAR